MKIRMLHRAPSTVTAEGSDLLTYETRLTGPTYQRPLPFALRNRFLLFGSILTVKYAALNPSTNSVSDGQEIPFVVDLVAYGREMPAVLREVDYSCMLDLKVSF
jgi:hypothetical protein